MRDHLNRETRGEWEGASPLGSTGHRLGRIAQALGGRIWAREGMLRRIGGRGRGVLFLLIGLCAGVLGAQGSDRNSEEIQTPYDLEELKRLLEIAQESGFSEDELRKITVEDENGVSINAYEFVKMVEERRRKRLEAEEALRKKVYLTPKDIITELDSSHSGELNHLRDTMIFED